MYVLQMRIGSTCEICVDPTDVWFTECTNYYCQNCSSMRHKHITRRSHNIQQAKTTNLKGTHIENFDYAI